MEYYLCNEEHRNNKSFDTALVHVLRHDPDVIVLGEMRDLSTISTALRAAETGLLMIGTLRTTDTVRIINRVNRYVSCLSTTSNHTTTGETIEAVLSQTLLNRISG
jgi:twitching motility protein PilT